MNSNFIRRFEAIIVSYFTRKKLKIEYQQTNGKFKDVGYDLIVTSDRKVYIEVKFYRSVNIQRSLIESTVSSLARSIKSKGDEGYGLIIFNNKIPAGIKEEMKATYGIFIWDRDILFNEFSIVSSKLKQDFEQLLLEAQQGTQVFDSEVFVDDGEENSRLPLPDTKPIDPGPLPNPAHVEAKRFARKLEELDCGKTTWSKYEKLMVEILKFVFKKDLTLWETQQRTDDALSRFDLICRINAYDDFWKSVVQSFNTRFLLFEFKNYCDQVTQHAVYLTERYLYRNALRSVAIVISRKGPNESAIQAAKGALRENGKLIFFLSDQDILNLLEGVQQDKNSNDYLADILDDWLVALSR